MTCAIPWCGSDISHLHSEHLAARFDSAVLEGELVLTDDRAAVFVAGVGQHVELWRPHLKLPLPINDGGQGSADQIWPFGVTLRGAKTSC